MTAKKIQNRDFFTCEAPELAKKLIGKLICHKVGSKQEKNEFIIRTRITETEAYLKDDSCLDYNRQKKETCQILIGGHIHLPQKVEGRRRMDIVANIKEIPESVLIAKTDGYDGPQKTLWALDINDHHLDGLDLTNKDSEVWIEDDGTIAELKEPTTRTNVHDSRLLCFSAKTFKFI